MSTLQAFDDLLLLQRGGTTIYAGPLGRESNDLIDYFEALGVEPKPQGLNPATWMLEISTPAAEERTGVDFTQVYIDSGLKRWGPATPTQAPSCGFQQAGLPHVLPGLQLPSSQRCSLINSTEHRQQIDGRERAVWCAILTAVCQRSWTSFSGAQPQSST